MFKLYARDGWGSVLVEAQLAWYGLAYDRIEVGDLFGSAEARETIAGMNPLAQIPTLVLPDGQVMTESAAITLHLADLTGSTALVPGAVEPTRAAFLRWLVYLVANIYPTFTYADDPSRFVPVEEARKPFRANLDQYAQRLWQVLESAASLPWFLGQRFSALDIYIACMTRWRPGRAWFAEHAPRLTAAAAGTDKEAKLREVLERNFPTPP